MKLGSKFEKLFSKKIFLSFIISYLIIATIPFSALLYSYFTAESNLKEQISYSIDENLDICLNTIDERISSLSIIARNIQNSEQINNIISNLSDTPWEYTNMKLSDTLLVEAKKYCDTTYCYFPEKNYFVSTSYTAYPDEFFNMFYKFGSDEERKNFENALRMNSYCRHIVTEDSNGEKYIDLLYSVPLMNIDSNISFNIGFRISYKTIISDIKKYTDIRDKNIYFLDRTNQLVFSATSFDYAGTPDSDSYIPDTISAFDGNIHFAKAFSSNNWMMITVIQNNSIIRSIAHIRYVTIFIMIICLFLSAFLTKIFSTTNYRPIKLLLSSADSGDSCTSDYEKLEEVLLSIQNQKRSMHQLNIDKERMEYHQFLTALVSGNTEKYSPLEKFLDKYNVSFKSKFFSVVVFFIKNPGDLFNDCSSNSDVYKNTETISFIIKNVFEELINENMNGYVFEYNGLISSIVNIPENKLNVWKNELSDILSKANTFMSKNFNFSFVAGISNLHTGIPELSSAFTEANSIFDYHSRMANVSHITYSETLQRNADDNSKQLSEAICSGDFEMANALAENSLSSARNDAAQFQLQKSKIILTILNTLHSNNISESRILNQIFIESKNILNDESCSNTEIYEILKKVCDLFKPTDKDSQNGTTSKIAGMIKEYIDNNYTDSDLNVSMVGYHFDMSPYYLSSIFKKAEGISILEYISKVRVNSSIDMLMKGATLAEIAKETGFNSTHTYMRQFNNLMGCTPKQYINSHQ